MNDVSVPPPTSILGVQNDDGGTLVRRGTGHAFAPLAIARTVPSQGRWIGAVAGRHDREHRGCGVAAVHDQAGRERGGAGGGGVVVVAEEGVHARAHARRAVQLEEQLIDRCDQGIRELMRGRGGSIASVGG